MGFIDLNHPDLINKIWINQGEIPTTPTDYISVIDGIGDGDGLVESWEIVDYFTAQNWDHNSDGDYNFDDFFHTSSIFTDSTDNDTNGYVDDLAGWSMETNGNYNNSFGSHGTAVASLVGAETNNNQFMASICQECLLMPVENSLTTTSSSIEAMEYAYNNGADIVNASYGIGNKSSLEEQATEDLFAAGTLMVSSAGNDASSEAHYPSDFETVVSVGAINDQGQLAEFSS